MPSYDSFMCPNCEHHFRVIWPDPLPSHYDVCSKIKIKCPDCRDVIRRPIRGSGSRAHMILSIRKS